MKAIILAAGMGTRLGNITSRTPKCLLKIDGVPILGIWLEKLYKLGVSEFLVNTHYLHQQVFSYLSEHRLSKFVKIVHEKKLLGTAGTLKKNLSFMDKDTFIIHADNYCKDTLVTFLKNHQMQPDNILLSMLTFKADNPSECGVVKTDKNDILIDYFEKVPLPPTNIANAAVFLVSKEFRDWLSKNAQNEFDFCKQIIPKLKNKAYCFKTKSFFIDIGSPSNLQKANNFSSSQF